MHRLWRRTACIAIRWPSHTRAPKGRPCLALADLARARGARAPAAAQLAEIPDLMAHHRWEGQAGQPVGRGRGQGSPGDGDQIRAALPLRGRAVQAASDYERLPPEQPLRSDLPADCDGRAGWQRGARIRVCAGGPDQVDEREPSVPVGSRHAQVGASIKGRVDTSSPAQNETCMQRFNFISTNNNEIYFGEFLFGLTRRTSCHQNLHIRSASDVRSALRRARLCGVV